MANETQARAKRTRAKKNEAPAAVTLLPALRFTQRVLAANRRTVEQHNMISAGWCVGFDGVLCAGYPIREDLHAYPHAEKLLAALERCGDEPPSIAQLDSGRLRVKAGKFSATVDCLPDSVALGLPNPDPSIAPVSDTLKTALQVVGVVAAESAPRVILACVKVGEGSAEATNGAALLEYWHGHSMPTALIPKRAAAEIVRHPSPLVSFGYGGNSLTFYFADGSFIRTQLYAERWPNMGAIWPAQVNPWPIPAGLFEAVAAVLPFGEGPAVHFGPDGVRSHPDPGAGASYAVAGLPSQAYNGEWLRLIAAHVKTVDFTASKDKAVFFGDNFRAAIMQIRVTEPAPV